LAISVYAVCTYKLYLLQNFIVVCLQFHSFCTKLFLCNIYLQAVKDWLSLFSCVRYPTRKPIPRSGVQPVIPLLPSLPITSHPQAFTLCTSSVSQPLVTACFSGRSPTSSPAVEVEEQLKNDADSNQGRQLDNKTDLGVVEMPKSNTAADIDMTGDKEPETKPKGNNPTSRTEQKVVSGEVHSSDAVQGDVLLEQEINNQSKADIIPVKSNELEESGGSGVTPGVDVEMNEENKEDKVPDVMQTEQESPLKQSPSVVQVFILIKQLVLFELELNV